MKEYYQELCLIHFSHLKDIIKETKECVDGRYGKEERKGLIQRYCAKVCGII